MDAIIRQSLIFNTPDTLFPCALVYIPIELLKFYRIFSSAYREWIVPTYNSNLLRNPGEWTSLHQSLILGIGLILGYSGYFPKHPAYKAEMILISPIYFNSNPQFQGAGRRSTT